MVCLGFLQKPTAQTSILPKSSISGEGWLILDIDNIDACTAGPGAITERGF